MPKLIAQWWIAMLTTWLVWAMVAPITFEARKVIQPIDYNCPSPAITHGVGSDLRTYSKARDLCSQNR